MSNIKDKVPFHIVVKSNEDFIKAKLILEAYFKSVIRQNLTYFHSRVLVVDQHSILTCYATMYDLPYVTREISFDYLINNY